MPRTTCLTVIQYSDIVVINGPAVLLVIGYWLTVLVLDGLKGILAEGC